MPGKYSGNLTYENMNGFFPTKMPKGQRPVTTKQPDKNWISLPNGVYKNVIALSTKEDSNVFLMSWDVEIRERLGEEEF
jgi:hypothetical protein